MMEISTSVSIDRDASGAVRRATERMLMDAADKGFLVSQEKVPKDRGAAGLAGSGVEPQQLRDGSVVWGYNAPYAEAVEEGAKPHWAPIEPLKGWARRVLGEEDAAYAVQWKIAQEGTPPQPYAEPGAEAMAAFMRGGKIKEYLREEL